MRATVGKVPAGLALSSKLLSGLLLAAVGLLLPQVAQSRPQLRLPSEQLSDLVTVETVL